ncbi:MAG: hypothetical protein AAGB48_01630 [Planctomycetota bacterium]
MNTPFGGYNRDDASQRQPATPAGQPVGPSQEQEQDLFNLIALAKTALRGRVVLAAALGILLAVPFTVIGYNLTSLTYVSEATFEVRNSADTLVFDNVGATRERLETYIERQTEFVRSQRVLALAVESEELRSIGWANDIQGQRSLREKIGVSFHRRDSTFNVFAEDEDAVHAEIALRAVSDAYLQLVAEENSTENEERRLDEQIRRLDANISNIRANISAATAEFGSAPIESQITLLEQRNIEILDRIDTLEAQISLRERLVDDGEVDIEDPVTMTVDELADQDRDLEVLLTQRTRIESEISSQSQQLGERHPTMRALRNELAGIERLIAERAEVVRDRLARTDPAANPEALNLEQLREQLTIENQRKAENDRRRRELNRTWSIIQEETGELELLLQQRKILAEQKGRLEIEREALREGRIRLITPATPAQANSDKRKMLAAAGFVGGGGLGIGLVALYGIMRRTLRYVDDVDDPMRLPPLVGTLPEIDKKDPDAEHIAATSVHNLRNMLHTMAQYSDHACQVILCTSAEPGDGKTTLIQSLGASYALTGLRTIVVDLDLVGGGLSARLGMVGRRGVADLLGGLEPTKCIKRTSTDKLYALPAGDRDACRPEQLAHRPVQQVIEWLRERFDIVLIDSGPVLGSLEAGLCAPAADQVLLVVPRGQPDRRAKAAVGRLERLGAQRIGLVFNRALTIDLKQSISAASIGAPSTPRPVRRPAERRLDDDASIAGSIPPPSDASAAAGQRPPHQPPAAEGGTRR